VSYDIFPLLIWIQRSTTWALDRSMRFEIGLVQVGIYSDDLM
jgi:hypothetical protein